MERRLLLVFGLTFLVILLFQPLLKKYLPTPPPAQNQQQSQPEQKPSAPPVSAPAVPASPGAAGSKQSTSETETVVENDFYRITFSNRGAQVKSWILKKYDDDQGKPLDLVNAAAASKYGYPLSLWTYDETQRNKLNSVLYVASDSGALRVPGQVSFEYADQDLSVRKTFKFDATYVISVESTVVSKGSVISAFPMWPAGLGDQTTHASYASSQIEHQYNSNIERLAIKKISGGGTIKGPFNWAALADGYFAMAFIPDNPADATMVTLRNSLDLPKDPQNPSDTAKVDVLGVAMGNMVGASKLRVYAGPKSLPVLESIQVPTIVGASQNLRDLVNFGFFSIIARPLFVWLKWTYEHIVPNWGWAIVIQTLIINIALLPLRISSMKSALKMQKVQPQMNAIKEKYKKYSMKDPRKQEMNAEIGALMKREGVNPAGGCLPMLIQMPFLFAYYSMLGAAIDLRHAPWLWIHDLSSKDPWHILPLGVIATMFLTQRMTPQAGMDPAQQKMMNVMMPVMLGVISWSLAAGLCLYWSVGNLIAVVQQMVMNRTTLGREMREIALKRAKKKDK